MKRTADLREFWDAIDSWSPETDENKKWEEVHMHGASKVEVLKDDEHQKRVVSVMLKEVMPREGDNVLDFGCGVGRITRQLSLLGCSVKAVDISPKIIDYARDYCHDLGDIEFIIGDGHGCGNTPDEWADKIVSAFVLQHMPSRQVILDCLMDFCRVLKPKGKVCIQSRYEGYPEGAEKVGLLGVRLSGSELADVALESGLKLLQLDDPFGNPDLNLYRLILEK